MTIKEENRLFLFIYKYNSDLDKYLSETKESEASMKKIIKYAKLVHKKYGNLIDVEIGEIDDTDVCLAKLENKLLKRLDTIADINTDPSKIAKAISVVHMINNSNVKDDDNKKQDKAELIENALTELTNENSD